MALDEALAGRFRRQLSRRKNIEEKQMFGGVGFLLKGNMLVGVWKDSLIARVGPEEGEAG
jgi:TfoX/Sxy family transcriptional regulator of competence genes